MAAFFIAPRPDRTIHSGYCVFSDVDWPSSPLSRSARDRFHGGGLSGYPSANDNLCPTGGTSGRTHRMAGFACVEDRREDKMRIAESASVSQDADTATAG